MKIRIEKSFAKDVDKITQTNILRKIHRTLADIMQIKNQQDIPNLKKIKGTQAYYRLRIGDYRIGLSIKNDLVTFIRVLHRKDIYKYFP